ncbi:GAF domain-containing protein [Nonomuraea sp. NPDC050663]|uniref:helix-turn-helix domain-containing protein n=1 Tax=Nonomuraea sp. NPDC050663 TaxID=3364370 RepID=UPI00378A5D2E
MGNAELDRYSRRLREAREAGRWSSGARKEICESWGRSFSAGIDVDIAAAPLVYEHGAIRDIRRAHPLDPLTPMIINMLKRMADESAHILIVTDAHGRILWREGHSATKRAADRVGLSDGHIWAEGSVGTNGIGTALATRKPVHVYSEEHIMRALHVWSCSGAPIIDPDTDEVLGCIDVSGTSETLHPATVALVETVGRLAESQLAVRMHERDHRLRAHHDALRHRTGVLITATGRVIAGDSTGSLGPRISVTGTSGFTTLPDGRIGMLEPFHGGYLLHTSAAEGERQPVRLNLLGDGTPSVYIGDRNLALSLRHAEILALLALHPHGLTAEQLSFHLYGDDGNPVTIRAEIHRLRAQLGGTIAAKPYRLTTTVQADFLTVRHLLADRDHAGAAKVYGGPLLPRSESPTLRRERDELEVQVRTCLLRYGTPDDLWAYAQTANGRGDYEVLEQLVTVLPPGDPRALAAHLRLSVGD